MKKFMALVLAVILCMCAVPTTAQEASTYGRYLMQGHYEFGGGDNVIVMWADIMAYEVVDSLTIEVVVYRQLSTSDIIVWSGSITETNSDYAEFPDKTVSMIPGYYFAEFTYKVTEGSKTEYDYAYTDTITVR